MRVLFLARHDALAFPAGDTVHIGEIRAALASRGVETGLCVEADPDLVGWDVAHAFNILRADQACLQAAAAARQGVPLVVTPLYWNVRRLAAAGCEVDGSWLRRWEGEQRLRRRALRQAAAVVASGLAERRFLEEDFGPLPVRVVPVAAPRQVSAAREPAGGEGASGCPGPPGPGRGMPFVLTVGRVAPHKNQLALIRALAGTGLSLVSAGPVHDGGYLRRCLDEGRHRATFLGPVSARTLRRLFRAAAAHALASWCELPGLATLEAASLGRPVVTTAWGTAPEYVGRAPGTFFCEPGDPDSIRAAVLRAVGVPAAAALAERVGLFTWDGVASSLVRLYREVSGLDHDGEETG